MGPGAEERAPCCVHLGLRVLASLSALAVAGALTLAVSSGAESVARHAAHGRIELPNAAALLVGWFTVKADIGVKPSPLAALATLATLAVLMLPYFLACACVPSAHRGTPGAIAFRLAVHVAWCVALGLLAAMALALPFACL